MWIRLRIARHGETASLVKLNRALIAARHHQAQRVNPVGLRPRPDSADQRAGYTAPAVRRRHPHRHDLSDVGLIPIEKSANDPAWFVAVQC